VRLNVSREMTPDAYLVRISVSDGKTDEVQVTPKGRSLDISRNTDTRTEQEGSFDEGRGYQRSFSYSSGSIRQYVALPADADLGAMTRETKDGTITLRIPRRAYPERGPGG
jgi:HSP20 family molecular chaperone IbpA